MSKKVKTFFLVFLNSLLPQPKFYNQLLKIRFRFSLKYFITLIFFINFILWLIFFIKYKPFQIFSFKQSLISSLNKFPSDLTIKVKNGQMTTNYNHPYFFWLDYQDKKNLILVVDESADINKINKYESYLLLTKSNLVMRLPEFEVLPLRNDLTIDSKSIRNIIDIINNIDLFPYVLPIGLILVFILPIFIIILEFLYLAVISWLVFSFSYFFLKKHHKIHFKKILQLTLHSSTVPLLISLVMFAFYPKLGSNLWFPFLIVLFLSVAIYEAYFSEESHHHTAHHETHPHHTHHQSHST